MEKSAIIDFDVMGKQGRGVEQTPANCHSWFSTLYFIFNKCLLN